MRYCVVVLLVLAATLQATAGGGPDALALRMFYHGIAYPPSALSDSSAFPSRPDSVHHFNSGRVWLLSGLMATAIVTIHLYQQSGWWRDNRTSFHFQEDLLYGLNVDKFGHFYGAYLLNFTISKALVWADMSEKDALWYGAGGALLFQTYVEVEDGFSTWGFDRVDWASDLAGAAWMPLRSLVPALRVVNMKLSYHPSDLLGSAGGRGFKGQKHIVIDDYEGQTIWFTLDVPAILPERVRSFWPGFLHLAYGYGVRDVAHVHPYRVYYLAPDLDMTKIIPQSSSFLRTLSEALNFIHFPLPAWRFYPTHAFYGIYF